MPNVEHKVRVNLGPTKKTNALILGYDYSSSSLPAESEVRNIRLSTRVVFFHKKGIGP